MTTKRVTETKHPESAAARAKRIDQTVAIPTSTWCGQCGHWYWKPACGPTHALIFSLIAREIRAAERAARKGKR